LKALNNICMGRGKFGAWSADHAAKKSLGVVVGKRMRLKKGVPICQRKRNWWEGEHVDVTPTRRGEIIKQEKHHNVIGKNALAVSKKQMGKQVARGEESVVHDKGD